MATFKNLTTTDHNRDVIGMKYIYPVVSRRAGGVSIGINLNVNNACNWRCIYCNVPELKRGAPDAIDMEMLERELRSFLQDIVHGDFMQQHVGEADRQLQDIAFSGNGEPTSAKEFPQVLQLVASVLKDFGLLGKLKIRLITNGSMMDKASVLDSMHELARLNGEVWFKLDAATQQGIRIVNDVNLSPESHVQRLIKCAKTCPTFIQTCMFKLDGELPSEADIQAYLALVTQVKYVIAGVHLYGLARQSLQPEAYRLQRLSPEWLEEVGEHIRSIGVKVFVSP
jgi:wyosine [tRNA(Phe)-imidazoG37] synthetase (radical SAM superfamily)